MKTPFIFCSLLIIFLSAQSATAEFTRAKCQDVLTGNDVIQVSRNWNATTRLCYISVHPRDVVDLKYRDYYFDNTGFFMVFNSYGAGDESKTAGARGFYVLPKILEYPDYSFEPNNDVIVKMVSGHEFRISGKDFSVVSLSDGTFSEKPLSPKNEGGIEIALKKGYWLDSGFRLGGLRLQNPNNKTKVQSANSTGSCSLVNKYFLNYSQDGDFVLKYTGPTLTEALQKKCPQIKL